LSAAAVVFAALLVGSPTAEAAGTSSIAGTITLPAGFSFSDPKNPGQLAIGHVDASGTSAGDVVWVSINPDGTYQADGLVPGQRYVAVVSIGYTAEDLMVNKVGLLTTAYGGWTSMAEEFYNKVSDPLFTKIVAPAAGTTTQNIDITMAQGGVISGNVTPANAKSLYMNVCEVQDYPNGACNLSPVGADGSYQAVVKPGNQVVVFASATGYVTTFLGGAATPGTLPRTLPAAGVTPVTITAPGGTETGADIQLVLGATITGKITPSNADDPWVSLYEVVDQQLQNYCYSAIADGESYSFTVVPGSTVVIVGWAAGFQTTWFGGATGWPSSLPQAGITQITAPGGGQTLPGQNIALVRDGAAPVKPMTRFTLGAGMTQAFYGYGRILAVDSKGVLWSYGLGFQNKPSAGYRLGTGFSSYQVFGPGDLNGDGYSDVLGISSDGKLWLFPGNGDSPLSKGKQVGWGWSAGWRMIPAGDLTGDGQPDLLGIDPTGDLYLYQGASDGTFPYPKVKVGWGWKNWNLYAAGDLNGDGKSDILGIDSKGDLYQYRGSGNASNPFPYAKEKAGWGWNGGFVMAAGADLNGDGKADIVSRQTSTKNLYFYPGLGDAKFGTKTLIDTGW